MLLFKQVPSVSSCWGAFNFEEHGLWDQLHPGMGSLKVWSIWKIKDNLYIYLWLSIWMASLYWDLQLHIYLLMYLQEYMALWLPYIYCFVFGIVMLSTFIYLLAFRLLYISFFLSSICFLKFVYWIASFVHCYIRIVICGDWIRFTFFKTKFRVIFPLFKRKVNSIVLFEPSLVELIYQFGPLLLCKPSRILVKEKDHSIGPSTPGGLLSFFFYCFFDRVGFEVR